jgi:hypothetical protein
MIHEIYDTISRTINSNLINYGYGCTIYDEQQISSERTISDDFLIARVPTNKSKQGIIFCSFRRCGYGFFLENTELTESLQVYGATDDLDYYYTIKKVTDKSDQNTKIKKSVFNKMELLGFLTKYFEEKEESFITSDDVDSIENGFYEFIRCEKKSY